MKNFNKFQVFSPRLINKINNFLDICTNEKKVIIPLLVSLEYLNFKFGHNKKVPQKNLETEFKQFSNGVLQDIRNFILLCIEEEIPMLDVKQYFDDKLTTKYTEEEKVDRVKIMSVPGLPKTGRKPCITCGDEKEAREKLSAARLLNLKEKSMIIDIEPKGISTKILTEK